jgi:hypothetical protein
LAEIIINVQDGFEEVNVAIGVAGGAIGVASIKIWNSGITGGGADYRSRSGQWRAGVIGIDNKV